MDAQLCGAKVQGHELPIKSGVYFRASIICVGTRHMLDLPRSSTQHDIIRCERLSNAGASTLRPVSLCIATGVPG